MSGTPIPVAPMNLSLLFKCDYANHNGTVTAETTLYGLIEAGVPLCPFHDEEMTLEAATLHDHVPAHRRDTPSSRRAGRLGGAPPKP